MLYSRDGRMNATLQQIDPDKLRKTEKFGIIRATKVMRMIITLLNAITLIRR